MFSKINKWMKHRSWISFAKRNGFCPWHGTNLGGHRYESYDGCTAYCGPCDVEYEQIQREKRDRCIRTRQYWLKYFNGQKSI